MTFRALAISSLALVLFACSTNGDSSPFDGGTGGSSGTGNGGSAGHTAGSAGSTGGSGDGGTGGENGASGAGGTSGTSASGASGTSGHAGEAGEAGTSGSAGTTAGQAGSSATGGSNGASGSGAAGTSGEAGAAGSSGTTTGGMAGAAGDESFGGASGSSGLGGVGGTGDEGGASGSSGGSGTAGAGGTSSLPTCSNPSSTAEVFAHSPDTLYRIDTTTLTLTTVGTMNCGTVIDIALDKTGEMYGTTFGGLIKINKQTAACTSIASGSYPNSLSFVPAGTVHPDKEALVGYNGSTYVEIDPVTGAVTTIGAIGSSLASSGDIVSVINGGTYLTVTGPNCADCLVQVNPTNGSLVENFGPIGHSGVYGLAFWGGIVYGFDAYGSVFSYDIALHTTTPVAVNGASQYYGAGSTTCAPPIKQD